jgi:hypothetical protein
MTEPLEPPEMASSPSSEGGAEVDSAEGGGRRKLLRPFALIGILVIVVVAGWVSSTGNSLLGKATPTPEPLEIDPEEIRASALLPIGLDQLPPFSFEPSMNEFQISRHAELHTVIPSRPRIEILEYEVKEGDNLFGIGEKFNLKPETIFWGNWYTLGGDPHTLRPGQILNILPVDGVLHEWTPGEGLNGVASFYGVTADEIINWPGNNLDTNVNRSLPPIEAGTELVIPGGRREPPSWQMVRITRTDPAVAKVLGPGYCGSISSGAIGDGVFGWPTPSTGISGYGYIPGVHEAIDIGGASGVGISASDDGVVVYSGWNDWGYGLVVVIDHGNGWQTLYAHLSQINAGCGQSVSQGEIVGLMGCTGNCTGPHLHFEMRHDSWGRVNPLTILP